jgi:FkbM family methyltransferase
MNFLKKIFTRSTGYWLHKLDTLPVGADLFFDIRNKIGYPSLDVLFDVGANIGQTMRWFRFYLPYAKIYCFEPVRSTFEQLSRNAKGNDNCVLENMALGERRTEKLIRLFEGNMAVLNSLDESLMNNTKGAKEECIRVETLDQYCEKNGIAKIDLLKIDTEGYDINVLKGAERMINDGRISMIYCETGFQIVNKRNTSFIDLTRFLEERQYYFFGLYQVDYNDWKNGNNYGNALYVHRSAFRG